MPKVLVTGSNRGLGIEWVRQYAEEGWRVFATCRHPAEADDLKALAHSHRSITVHRLDITKPDDVSALARELRNESIDVLINNAGLYLEKYEDVSLDNLRFDDWELTFRVNTLGCLRVTRALKPMVAASTRRLVVAISTHMGSITEIETADAFYYRSSKAALNASMKGVSLELKPLGIGVLILHPGWNNTRMGGPDAPFRPVDTVAGMRRIIERFDMRHTGRFFRFNGEEIPW